METLPTFVDVPAAVARAGIDVTVVQAATTDEVVRRDGVAFRFVRTPHWGRLARHASMAGGLARLVRAVRMVRPDVVHVHSFQMPGGVTAVQRAIPSAAVLVQDHADRLPRPGLRWIVRRALRSIHGVIFTAERQADPWTKERVIPARVPVFTVPEVSTRFSPGNRDAARRETGLYGDPCLLWVGRLNRNKDPITALEATRIASATLPNLQLWMYYTEAPLLARLRDYLEAHPQFASRVHLAGAVSHPQVEALYRGADLFVTASHRESCGASLIEALACGLPAVASDNPAFRTLVPPAIGRVFRRGDAKAMATCVTELASVAVGMRRHVRAHFEEHLSYPAVGRRLVEVYETVRR
jgi:glycosyltransferase involved in cell wall biosynthesis